MTILGTIKHSLLLTLAAASLLAADASGTWTGTLTIPSSDGGDKSMPAHLVLKQEGAQVTGTAGPDASEQHTIQNGKAENGILNFEVARERGIMKFVVKHEGDGIKGEVSRERDGQTEMAKLDVKRAK